MAADQLEAILTRLLLPDTGAVTLATQELKYFFKSADSYVTLCNVFASSSNAQIRQYSALLLRRKVTRLRNWFRLKVEIRNGIKSTVLKSLEIDPEKSVRNAVGQLAGTIAKHELPRNTWPELLVSLKTAITSSKTTDREVGVFVLSTIADTSAAQLQPYMKQLLQLMGKSLQDRSSPFIPYYSIKTLTALGCIVGSDELQTFQNLIPLVFQVIGQLVTTHEENACESLQIFDELIECEVGVLAPHTKSVVEFCLHLAGDSNLGNEIRVKAITIIGSLAHLKKKTIIKHKLIGPILKVLFPIMCTPSDDIEDDIPCDGAESNSPVAVSAQVIDILALHLPPEKLFQPLMHYVESALQSQNPYDRRAAFVAMAVTVEGCADYIRTKYLPHFVQCLYKGFIDQHLCVRNASLFALGQFAEHLQPDIGNYAQEMLPLILQCLKEKVQNSESNKELPSTTKLFYALEHFCDSLGERLIPFLPSIIEHLFSALTNGPLRVQELAVSSLGVVADAVKEAMLPHFERTLEYLKTILNRPNSSDILPVQLQALDTLGMLARTVGKERFFPYVNDSINLGLSLITNIDDPDLRRCTYGLFASISAIIKEEMAPYLPTVIPHMLNSIVSSEGVVVQTSPNKSGHEQLPLFVDLSDEEDEEENEEAEIDLGVGNDVSDVSEDDDYEEDVDAVGLDIENGYLKEKQDTCSSLKEIAENTRTAFLPYLDKVNAETNSLMEHPSGEIRGSAIEALTQFCCTFATVIHGVLPGDPEYIERRDAVTKMGLSLLLKFTVIVREDKDRTVAMTALEAINDLTNNIGNLIFVDRNYVGTVISVVKDVLQLKMSCQDHADDESLDENSDGEQAEYDRMLLEYAGELVPSLAKIVQPGSQFAPYFAGVLSILVAKAKRKMNVAEKSFSVGILAETVAAMKDGMIPFVSHLYPVFLSLAQDDDEEVRSNAIFGLGVLVEFGGQVVTGYYSTILQLLSNTLAQETNSRVTDNICAAVARMIITNTEAVPLDNVFPVLIRFLPLRQDFEENSSIIRCMTHLLNIKHAVVFNHMPTILQVMATISQTPQVNEEAQLMLNSFIHQVSVNCSSGFETVLQSLNSELADKLRLSANAPQS